MNLLSWKGLAVLLTIAFLGATACILAPTARPFEMYDVVLEAGEGERIEQSMDAMRVVPAPFPPEVLDRMSPATKGALTLRTSIVAEEGEVGRSRGVIQYLARIEGENVRIRKYGTDNRIIFEIRASKLVGRGVVIKFNTEYVGSSPSKYDGEFEFPQEFSLQILPSLPCVYMYTKKSEMYGLRIYLAE